MGEGLVSEAGYRRLVKDVGVLIAEGRRTAESLVGQVMATTYWGVGRRIVDERLTERAGYGSAVLARLAEDLEMEVRTLRGAVQLARVYEVAPESGLSWSHYRELMRIGDDEERAYYEARAREERWGRRALVEAIRRGEFEAEADGPAGRGEAAGTVVLARPKALDFLFEVEVERVVDGDTLLVLADLGFDVIRRQRLRLSGVNAAAAGSKEGKAATRFVVERLAAAAQVVVTTEREDLHGRYVAHVFYATRRGSKSGVARRGRYLNGELVAAGLAAVA